MKEAIHILFMFIIWFLPIQECSQPSSDPICNKPNVPFTSRQAAIDAMEHYHICTYEWWRSDSQYNGMAGYRKVYGNDGHLSNESTVFEIDSTPFFGFARSRAAAIVYRNFVRATQQSTCELLEWSSYALYYKANTSATLNVGKYKGSETTGTIFLNKTWFEDDSGILKYQWQNSTDSIMGYVLNHA
eukprot:697679_1